MKFTDLREELAKARADEVAKRHRQNVNVWDPIGEALAVDARQNAAPDSVAQDNLVGLKGLLTSEHLTSMATDLHEKLREIADDEHAALIYDELDRRLVPRQLEVLNDAWVKIMR